MSPELPPLIGEAPAFLAMLEHVSRAAPLQRSVLVIGERGTGKEHIAARLHYLSGRWEQPLVKLNCAALTESLLESELFGHEAGAFTGATARRIGCFEQADGGTLILDELGTIPLRMQEKILRVIEYGEFQRVGGSRTRTTSVRIVGATNENLPARAAEGAFRRDLLDRLAFDVIRVPPLRERREDIAPLAYHFAFHMTAELHRDHFPGFDASAARALLAHDWPGNIRELKNTIERSVYRAPEPFEPLATIHFDPFALPGETSAPPRAAPGAAPQRARGEAVTDPATAPAGADDASPGGAHHPAATAPLPVDLKAELAAHEAARLREAVARAAYNQRAAADLLGLSYDQLRAALRRHDLVGELGRRRSARLS